MRFLTAFALGALVLTPACADRGREAARADDVPRTRAGEASGAQPFSGQVPRLGDAQPPPDTLRAARILGDSTAFAAISGIQPVGDKLFVSDRLMSLHLGLIDLRTGDVVSRVGRHGEGPDEFRDPGAFTVESASPPRAWVYDFQNRRLSLVGAGEGEELRIERSRPLNAGQSIEQPLRSGTSFIANGLFADYTLLVIDSAGRAVRQIEADPPFSPRDIPHAVGRRLLNRSYLTRHPDGDRMALAYQWASRIDFFTADGQRVGSVRGPRPTVAKYQVADGRFFWDPEGQMAYTGIFATARYVYAAFCGCREADDRDQRSQRLHVFRWNGDFVSELQLDRRVTAFAVSPDDGFLYASVAEPHPAVGEWRLPPGLVTANSVPARR